MKRMICLLLVLALLCGCSGQSLVRNEIPVTFYYISENPDYFSDTGILGPESRTLRGDQNSVEDMLNRYLKGPLSQDLSSPFPPDLRLIRAERGEREITLVFDDSLAGQTGIRLQLTCACIARTVAEYDSSFETVHIRAEHLPLEGDRETLSLRPDELILADRNAGQTNTPVLLYFSDLNSRYLLSEQDSLPSKDSAKLAELIVDRLIKGPKNDSLLATIPAGTRRLNVTMAERVCVVNLSEEFLDNGPQTALAERMTVFSLVNSLTQLDEVDAVDIRVEGKKLGRYFHLDLSDELQPDERMIGPVRSGVGEYDATLYVGLEGSEQLAPFPMRIRESAETNLVSQVMDALCGFEESNGYYSPAKELIAAHEEHEEGGVLRVMLTVNPADEAQLRLLTRSVTATLRELPEGKAAQLFVNNAELPKDSDPFQTDWVLP